MLDARHTEVCTMKCTHESFERLADQPPVPMQTQNTDLMLL